MNLLSECRTAFRLLRSRRRWLPELIIVLVFASVVSFTMEHLPEQETRVSAIIVTALAFFPLWLLRVYWEAKGWRAAQRESKLDPIRSSLILDAPVVYRLGWSGLILSLVWLGALGTDRSLTATALAIGSIFVASSFLHYLIQWTTIWMKTGAPFRDFLWNAIMGLLALLHPLFAVVWLIWLRQWSIPRLAMIRWIQD